MPVLPDLVTVHPRDVLLTGRHLLAAAPPTPELVRSIEAIGQTTPVLVDFTPDKPVLVAGHARILALRALKLPAMALRFYAEVGAGSGQEEKPAPDIQRAMAYLASNADKRPEEATLIAAARFFAAREAFHRFAELAGPHLALAPRDRRLAQLAAWVSLPPWMDGQPLAAQAPHPAGGASPQQAKPPQAQAAASPARQREPLAQAPPPPPGHTAPQATAASPAHTAPWATAASLTHTAQATAAPLAPLALAPRLAALAPGDLDALRPCLEAVRFSKNHLDNFLSWLGEAALARGLPLARLLALPEIGQVLAAQLSPPDRLAALCRAARAIRHPHLCALEGRFAALAKGLTAGTRFKALPSPGFETDAVRLEVSLSGPRDLLRAAKDIERLRARPQWHALWSATDETQSAE